MRGHSAAIRHVWFTRIGRSLPENSSRRARQTGQSPIHGRNDNHIITIIIILRCVAAVVVFHVGRNCGRVVFQRFDRNQILIVVQVVLFQDPFPILFHGFRGVTGCTTPGMRLFRQLLAVGPRRRTFERRVLPSTTTARRRRSSTSITSGFRRCRTTGNVLCGCGGRRLDDE